MANTIPSRRFGKTDVQISALGLGGHHLGAAEDEKTAVEIVHRAIDGGVTFFDNAWEYHKEWSDKQMAALREHGKQFSDGRYELFKSSVKYDGDEGRAQHYFPTTQELPA